MRWPDKRKRPGGHPGAIRRTTTQQGNAQHITVDVLLARLEGVRARGSGRWVARCPSHHDRTPSLSIRVAGDGALLVHCFAGCAAADICAALGLELSDLFPHRNYIAPSRDRYHAHAWREAFCAIHRECLIAAVGAENVARGVELDAEDRDRLWSAAAKIRAAVEICTKL